VLDAYQLLWTQKKCIVEYVPWFIADFGVQPIIVENVVDADIPTFESIYVVYLETLFQDMICLYFFKILINFTLKQ